MRINKFNAAMFGSILFLWAIGHVAAEGLELFYQRLKPTAVVVLVNGVHSGSANIVSSAGVVLTAGHIFLGKPDACIEVVSESLGRSSARLLEISTVYDLALLQIEGVEGELPYLEMAGKEPKPGDRLYTLSSPGYQHNVLVEGFVNSDRVNYLKGGYAGCAGYTEALYVGALIDRGSSGGAWVDEQALIVGVQSGWVDKLSTNSQSAGINLVSPAVATAAFVATQKAAERTWLGGVVEELWTQSRGFVERFPRGASGLAIHEVFADGPLAEAGVEREQLITDIDGKPVMFRHVFLDYLRSKKPGDEVELKLVAPDSHAVENQTVTLGRVE